MKIKELIEKLNKCNQDATINVVAHCRSYPFTVSASGSDGQPFAECPEYSFYVDALCTSEQANNSWENEVDRQSGAFTQEEIDNSTAWR